MYCNLLRIFGRNNGKILRISIFVKPIGKAFNFSRLYKSNHLVKHNGDNIGNCLTLIEIHFSCWRVNNERELQFRFFKQSSQEAISNT